MRWEPSRGGDLFPHLYGALPTAAAVSARPLALGVDGAPDLGELLPLTLVHSLATRALHRLDPEMAHRLTIAALKAGLGPKAPQTPTPDLAVTLAGLRLPNAIGLAAGFDKNAEAPDAMLAAGFGFVECGTVTPLPQPGNPSPRLFRLTEDGAAINRLGFNNGGLEPYAGRLAARPRQGVVGANIGANKDAADRIGELGVTGLMPALAARRLFHRQHLLAQHAGPARPAGGRCAAGTAGPDRRDAARAGEAGRPSAGVPEGLRAGLKADRDRADHRSCDHPRPASP